MDGSVTGGGGGWGGLTGVMVRFGNVIHDNSGKLRWNFRDPVYQDGHCRMW